MKSAIYETSGPAREYCQLAMNHYDGCTHGCRYCYAPDIKHQTPYSFQAKVDTRLTIQDIEESATRISNSVMSQRPILMSFLSDPYPPCEAFYNLTRSAMTTFHDHGLSYSILTKAGFLASRDFSIYKKGDSFGTTLTFLNEYKSRHWEPCAALPGERIENLMLAKQAGIPTWVSLEPVIEPLETLACIHASAPFVDHFKIGKLNHRNYAQFDAATWQQFLTSAVIACRNHKKGFYIKKSLGHYINFPDGYGEGPQLPMTTPTVNILEKV